MDPILLGGLHAHTNADPIPDLRAYPNVVAWAEGGAAAAARSEASARASFPDGTPFARHVLRVGAEQYAPFVLGNAAALDGGRKIFEIQTYGEPTTCLARPYPEQSRRLVQARIRDQLRDGERREVSAWLEDAGLECFLP